MAYDSDANMSGTRPRRVVDEPIYVDSNGRMSNYTGPYVTEVKDENWRDKHATIESHRREENAREESRHLRGRTTDQPVYVDSNGKMSSYVEPYVSDVKDEIAQGENVPVENLRREEGRYIPKRTSVSSVSASSEATSQATSMGTGISSVSPELLAEITEKIKREVVEHLKQTGTLDPTPEPPKPTEPMVREQSNKTSSTSSPPLNAQKVYTPPSPPLLNLQRRRSTTSSSPPPLSSPSKESHSPKDNKPSVRFMNRGPPDGAGTKRPVGTGRSYSTAELSTIDQKWGMLFDHDRNPTHRSGEFLRGLANHIIEDFEPKKNIVLTPEKMAAFYSKYRLDKEAHPFLTIFQSNAPDNISQLYQDIGCAHHLVSLNPSQRPTIPGLTPVGFAHWMTLFIMAYPDLESQRLQQVVLALPINADGPFIDNKPERLPKQISRHLLPSTEDRYARQNLSEAISDFLDETGLSQKRRVNIVQSPQTTSSAPIPNGSIPTKSKPIDIPMSKPIERERMPYVNSPSAGESGTPDDIPITSGGIKIERERQPYTAQPGSGKIYQNNESRAGATTTINSSTGRRERGSSVYHQKPNASARDADVDPVKIRQNVRDNGRDMGREREWDRDRDRDHRRSRANSNASRDAYIPPPRPAGARRQPSPPLKSHSSSTPGNINLNLGSASANTNVPYTSSMDAPTSERYAPAPSSSFGTSTNTVFTPSTYSSSGAGGVPAVFPISFDPRDSHPRERERSDSRPDARSDTREREIRERELRDRERERDRDRDRDRDWDDRYPAAGRERRMTNEEQSRPDISSPRDAERWDRLQEGMEEDFYRRR